MIGDEAAKLILTCELMAGVKQFTLFHSASCEGLEVLQYARLAAIVLKVVRASKSSLTWLISVKWMQTRYVHILGV